MGSLQRCLAGLTSAAYKSLESPPKQSMSWTWKGFWGDDPVYRFKQDNFFQSGRHKAEERFWVNYIHNDGSFYKPLRTRLSSTGSSLGSRTRNTSSGADSIPDMNHIQQEDTKKSESVKNEDTTEEVNEDKDDEKMSSVTCLSCSRCSMPIK